MSTYSSTENFGWPWNNKFPGEENLLLLRLRFMRRLEIKISQDRAGLVTLNYENMAFDCQITPPHRCIWLPMGSDHHGLLTNRFILRNINLHSFCLYSVKTSRTDDVVILDQVCELQVLTTKHSHPSLKSCSSY